MNVRIFDKLTTKHLIYLIFFSNDKIYYTKSNFLSKILSFFNLKRVRKLEWDLIELDYKGKKVITQIIENKLVDKIVYQFLDILNKKKNLENNFFNYLVKYYSTEKVIGDLSIVYLLAGRVLPKNSFKSSAL